MNITDALNKIQEERGALKPYVDRYKALCEAEKIVKSLVSDSALKQTNEAPLQEGKSKKINVGKKKKGNQETLNDIKRMNSQGMSDSHIARVIGLSQATVSKYRRELGLNPNYSSPSCIIPSVQKKQVIGTHHIDEAQHRRSF